MQNVSSVTLKVQKLKCVSGNWPYLQMDILIIVNNFALDHQVDYCSLD
jgi:hypothetical protein